MEQTTNTATKTRAPVCAWCGTTKGPLRELPTTSLNCHACEHRHLLLDRAARDLTEALLDAVHTARLEWLKEWAHVQAQDGTFTVLEGAEDDGWDAFIFALADQEERRRELVSARHSRQWQLELQRQQEEAEPPALR